MAENNPVVKVINQGGLTSTPFIEVAVRSSFGEADGDRHIKRDVDISDLYAGDTPTAQLISRARQLLADAEQRATKAQQQLAGGEVLGADHNITLLQANLPELFCCRSLSDGLGAVVIALHHALSNRKGDFLNLDQAYVVAVACQKLYNNPFMPFTAALDIIDTFTGAGLVTDPPEAEILSNVFAD